MKNYLQIINLIIMIIFMIKLRMMKNEIIKNKIIKINNVIYRIK